MYSQDGTPRYEYSSQDNEKLERAIKRMAMGEKAALAEAFEMTKTAIYGFVLSLLKDKYEAEDVFQEVYIKVYEHAASYEACGKPMAWMLTIAKNQCYMRFRRVKNEQSMEEVEESWTDSANVEDKVMLEAAFLHLSDEERNIVILHVLSGLKHREIARLLDLPLATVLSKYHRTIKKLKGILEESVNEN